MKDNTATTNPNWKQLFCKENTLFFYFNLSSCFLTNISFFNSSCLCLKSTQVIIKIHALVSLLQAVFWYCLGIIQTQTKTYLNKQLHKYLNSFWQVLRENIGRAKYTSFQVI